MGKKKCFYSDLHSKPKNRRSKRFKVFSKTKGRCWYCGKKITYANGCAGNRFTLDHLIPRAMGGADELGNLVPSCDCCNLEKGAMPVDEYRFLKTMGNFVKSTGVSFTMEQSVWLQENSRGLGLERYQYLFWFEAREGEF